MRMCCRKDLKLKYNLNDDLTFNHFSVVMSEMCECQFLVDLILGWRPAICQMAPHYSPTKLSARMGRDPSGSPHREATPQVKEILLKAHNL